MYYCKFNFNEVWDLPISMRRWWIDRYNKEKEAEEKAYEQKMREEKHKR